MSNAEDEGWATEASVRRAEEDDVSDCAREIVALICTHSAGTSFPIENYSHSLIAAANALSVINGGANRLSAADLALAKKVIAAVDWNLINAMIALD